MQVGARCSHKCLTTKVVNPGGTVRTVETTARRAASDPNPRSGLMRFPCGARGWWATIEHVGHIIIRPGSDPAA